MAHQRGDASWEGEPAACASSSSACASTWLGNRLGSFARIGMLRDCFVVYLPAREDRGKDCQRESWVPRCCRPDIPQRMTSAQHGRARRVARTPSSWVASLDARCGNCDRSMSEGWPTEVGLPKSRVIWGFPIGTLNQKLSRHDLALPPGIDWRNDWRKAQPNGWRLAPRERG